MTSSLKSTIDALKVAALKTKQTKAIEDALEQLDSTPKLLELSKLSADAFARLCSLLRDRLLPLYNAFPALALQYSVAILTIIYQEKINIEEAIDEKTRSSWETVQTALLSGILDFLEDHPTNGYRANVAIALYPVLRTVFFPSSSCPPHLCGGLFYTLYQLLSETVTIHPANQRKLRNPAFLGGKQIGIILSHTRDFLAIEALLELFAKLLPSTKSRDGLEKRNSFINEVFNPAIIAGSKDVVQILKTISTTDWEATFLKVLDILGRADITFPQLFETTNFRTHGLPSYTVDRLYIDQSGFLANLDQCSQVETLQISFSIIDGVKLSAPFPFKTSITIRLSSPPFVGQAALACLSEGDITLSFDIDNRNISRFLESLTKRDLKKDVIDQTERKLSKAKAHLEFDFQSENKRTPISTQDKVQNLARLWASNGSSSLPGEAMPTSPLVVKSPKPRTSPLRHKDAFATTDESDLSDPSGGEDDIPRQSSLSHGQSRGKVTAPILVDSDDEPQAMPRPRPRTCRNNVVLSEDEVASTDHRTAKTSVVPKGKSFIEIEALERRKSGDAVSRSRLEPLHTETTMACDNILPEKSRSAHHAIDRISSTNIIASRMPKTTTTLSNPPNIFQEQMTSPATGDPKTDTPTIAGRKRAAAKDPIPDNDKHPAKRFRGKNFSTDFITSPCATRQPPARKRYGRKGRSSSPTLPVRDEIDFDELPAALTDLSGSGKPTPRARFSALSSRGGKIAPTEQLVSGKSKAKQDTATVEQSLTQSANKDHASIEPTTSEFQLHSNAEPTITQGKAIRNLKPTRRSARVANIQADPASCKETNSSGARRKHSVSDESIPDKNLTSDNVPQMQFTQEAKPFIDSVKLSSPPRLPVSNLVTDASNIEPTASTSTIIKEPSIPSKPAQQNDVVMIDLTQDSPNNLSKIGSSPKKEKPVTTITTTSSPPDRERLTKLPQLILSSPKADLLCRPIAPSPDHNQNRSNSASDSSNRGQPRGRGIGSVSPSDYKNTRSHTHHFRSTYDNHFFKKTKSKEDPIPRIVDVRQNVCSVTDYNLNSDPSQVISELTEVIVQNASRRFDNVRNDLRVGSIGILFGTADDLSKMHATSVDCFNSLVDLEEEYADYRRKVIDGFGDLSKTSQEICGYLAETIQNSNRNSLSRKFSDGFFALPLPAIISNPKLVL